MNQEQEIIVINALKISKKTTRVEDIQDPNSGERVISIEEVPELCWTLVFA